MKTLRDHWTVTVTKPQEKEVEMGRRRISLGSKLKVSKPGKRTAGQEAQDAGGGIFMTFVGIGLGILFLSLAVKGCEEGRKTSQASAQVTTQALR